MSALCSVCKQTQLATADQVAMQACAGCAKTLGLMPFPPLSRPSRPCMRCNGMQFLRVIPREHSSKRSGEMNAQLSAPKYLTHAPTTVDVAIFSVDIRAAEVPIDAPGLGLVEIFACRSCGFLEHYCPTVNQIPADPVLMTQDVDYSSGTPYR